MFRVVKLLDQDLVRFVSGSRDRIRVVLMKEYDIDIGIDIKISSNHQMEVVAPQQQQLDKETKKFVFSIENILRPDPPAVSYSSRSSNQDRQDRRDYFPLAVSYAGQLVNHRFVNSLT